MLIISDKLTADTCLLHQMFCYTVEIFLLNLFISHKICNHLVSLRWMISRRLTTLNSAWQPAMICICVCVKLQNLAENMPSSLTPHPDRCWQNSTNLTPASLFFSFGAWNALDLSLCTVTTFQDFTAWLQIHSWIPSETVNPTICLFPPLFYIFNWVIVFICPCIL